MSSSFKSLKNSFRMSSGPAVFPSFNPDIIQVTSSAVIGKHFDTWQVEGFQNSWFMHSSHIFYLSQLIYHDVTFIILNFATYIVSTQTWYLFYFFVHDENIVFLSSSISPHLR